MFTSLTVNRRTLLFLRSGRGTSTGLVYESTFQSVRPTYHNAEIKRVQKENLSEKKHMGAKCFRRTGDMQHM